MSKNINLEHNEIGLSELLAALWAHKILITLVTSLSVFLAGYYSLIAEKKFTARSIFQIEQTNGSGINIPGELGFLASLAGMSSAKDFMANQDALLERIKGREFILRVSHRGSLKDDSYFNTYDPDYKDPF